MKNKVRREIGGLVKFQFAVQNLVDVQLLAYLQIVDNWRIIFNTRDEIKKIMLWKLHNTGMDFIKEHPFTSSLVRRIGHVDWWGEWGLNFTLLPKWGWIISSTHAFNPSINISSSFGWMDEIKFPFIPIPHTSNMPWLLKPNLKTYLPEFGYSAFLEIPYITQSRIQLKIIRDISKSGKKTIAILYSNLYG